MGAWQYKSRFSARVGIPQGTAVASVGGYPWDFTDATGLQLGLGIPSGVTINGAHNDSTTTIAVSSGALFKAGMEFTATTTETFKVISISSNNLTVATRGYGGGAAAALSGGEAVTVTPLQTTITGPYGSVLPQGGDGFLDFSGVRKGALVIPATWTAADLCFMTCQSRNGTYVPARDDRGSLFVITNILASTSEERQIPRGVFDLGPFCQLKSCTAAGGVTTGVNQAADRNLVFVGGE